MPLSRRLTLFLRGFRLIRPFESQPFMQEAT